MEMSESKLIDSDTLGHIAVLRFSVNFTRRTCVDSANRFRVDPRNEIMTTPSVNVSTLERVETERQPGLLRSETLSFHSTLRTVKRNTALVPIGVLDCFRIARADNHFRISWPNLSSLVFHLSLADNYRFRSLL